MRSWHRNLRGIGWFLGATRNEGLVPNSICFAPNLRRAPTRPEAPTTLEARKRFSDQRRPPAIAVIGALTMIVASYLNRQTSPSTLPSSFVRKLSNAQGHPVDRALGADERCLRSDL